MEIVYASRKDQYIAAFMSEAAFFGKDNDMDIRIKNTRIYTDKEIVKGDLCISGNRILAVGSTPAGFSPAREIDGKDLFAVPGLINCHTHSYMSVFRNIADDLSFDEWLFGAIMPREDKMTPEDGYEGALISCREMIESGTTCFMDMHMFPGMTAKAAKETGMRAVMTRGLTGPDREDAGAKRRLIEHLEETIQFADTETISFRLGPHAIYTCGEDYLRFLIEKAKEVGQGFHIHLSESLKEVEDCQRERGMSPVEYLDSIGFFEIPTCAAHCVHLSENDMDILAKKNVSVIHNPKSNLKLANGIAPIAGLLERGVNVCLGTDSQASNNVLNMYSEMNFAALLQKGVTGDPTVLPAKEVIRMATVNGAKALGIDKLGEIKEGYLADIALLDMGRTNYLPANDLEAALVYSSNGTESKYVIINGEVVYEK